MAFDASLGTPAAAGSRELLAVVEAVLRELHPGDSALPAVTMASALDRDLGFDSLGRMELLLRTERVFGIDLPHDTLQRAETVADLLDAVRRGAAHSADRAGVPPPAEPAVVLEGAPGENDTPADAQTLLEVLDWHLQAHPDRTQVIHLGDERETPISYRQLAEAASRIAAGLQRAGVAPRQCVAIMLPTSPEYFGTYLGVLRAGAIPVPIYPPARPSQLEDHVRRHTGILANAQAVLLVTVQQTMAVARVLQARVPGLRHVLEPAQLAAAGASPVTVPVGSDDIAFIQYTSGSTGSPKGVALTHANLLANIRAMAEAVQATPRDVFVSWLPLYHDMGLIGAWLGSLYVGFPLVVMPSTAFLARPVRWLQAIQRWHGTLSAGPNFAYELCLRRIDDAALAALDLHSWRLAFNGAEAVSSDTVRRFAQRFAPCGLRPEAVAPVYGLAEACVGLLFPPLGRVPPIDAVQREAFTREQRAVPAAADDPAALRFVGCGRPLRGHAVRIVDAQGNETGERIEGRLEFKGPSATRGYFRDPERTARLFDGDWLDSGDRAYVADGDVYVTGRVKDIVIRGGRNLYPEEIEEAVGKLDGVRKGCIAVFGSPDPQSGTERLVVLAEVRPLRRPAMGPLREAIARAVVDAIGEPPDDIVLAPPHTVLKTSSGKIRRADCRKLYESGATAAGRRGQSSPRSQLLRLALGAAGLRLRHLPAAAGRWLFGARALLVFGLLAPPTWLLTLCTRSPAAAWAAGRAAARALFKLAGVPLTVRGLEHLPDAPCVLVSNHGSYLDGMVLVAALPRPYSFVAKRELLAHWATGPYLRRLGAEFVERFDVQRAVDDAGRMAEAVARGRSLIVFPEGTFVARPGLLPFHLGAFLAAARAAVPVAPVSIQGTRQLLSEGSWWPRRSQLVVEVRAAIAPTATAPLTDAADLFAAAVTLRDAARQAIAGAASSRPLGELLP